MKLSTITINYNNKEGLKKTIESVMSQTWRDFEWIIIDGGSTDGSKELIESLTTNPLASNLISYWCSEPDKGIYNAMNKGIAHAKGEFLNFMNSGDCYYENNTIEKVLQYIDGDRADIYIGDIIWRDSKKVVRQNPMNISPLEIAINQAFLHQASFIRRSIQKKYLYDETLKIVSDWKFYIQTLILSDVKCEFLNMVISEMDSLGISSTNREQQLIERSEVLHAMFSKTVLREIRDYYYLKSISIVDNSEYIRVHNPRLYVLTRRIVSIIARIAKFLNKGNEKTVNKG